MSVPAAAFVVILGPFLLGRRHHVVVVRADELAEHVVGKVGHGLWVLHIHASVAFNDESLAFLRAHHCAKARAGRMVARVHDARIGEQVLAGGADGRHASGGSLEAVQRFSGGTGSHAPHEGSILDLDLIVLDVQVNGFVRCAFQNDGVIAC